MNALSTDAHALFAAAVRRVQADRLLSDDSAVWVDQSLEAFGEVRVAGMGKAAMAMAGVMEDRHPGAVDDGVVVVPAGYVDAYPDRLPEPTTVRVMEGGHPLPTDESVRAGRCLLEQAEAVGEGDLLVALVSGGGTALSTLPVDGVDVADLKMVYHALMTAGVPIGPANAVRKHLTKVGGGQLTQAAAPATVSGRAVSDVVGDDMSVIASGPTVPDPSTYKEALQVLYRNGLWHDVPTPVRDHLADGARGRRPETPGPDAPCFETAHTTLAGRNSMALAAARDAAQERGYQVRVLATDVEGEARTVGRGHVEEMLASPVEEPTCWLWGGETTVTVTGEGTGGRNQEVALGAALALENVPLDAVLLSGGTDGIDGPTDAAGAWATPSTVEQAQAAGVDPEAHLSANNAYPLFAEIGHLLRPGPTHTNVMDVQVGLVHP